MMKSEIRLLGIDDSPFTHFQKDVLVVGTFFRGRNFIDGILSTKVRKDGNNSTHKLALMINNSKFRHQLKAIFLDGIALAGFNVIDINTLSLITGLPVIVIMRKYPNKENMYKALMKIGYGRKIAIIEKAGNIYKYGRVLYQMAGITSSSAEEIIKISTGNSDIPECLRIAHIIASGIVRGESYGRA